MKKPDECGVSTVELAMILPLLVLILFGIIEFGLILYDRQVITNASREGARAGIVQGSTNLTVLNAVNADVAGLITFASNTQPSTSVIPSGGCGSNAFGTNLTVTVSYPYTFLVLDNLGFAGPNLTATTTMKCE